MKPGRTTFNGPEGFFAARLVQCLNWGGLKPQNSGVKAGKGLRIRILVSEVAHLIRVFKGYSNPKVTFLKRYRALGSM